MERTLSIRRVESPFCNLDRDTVREPYFACTRVVRQERGGGGGTRDSIQYRRVFRPFFSKELIYGMTSIFIDLEKIANRQKCITYTFFILVPFDSDRE